MVQTGTLNTEKSHCCSEVLLEKVGTTEKIRYLGNHYPMAYGFHSLNKALQRDRRVGVIGLQTDGNTSL